MSTEAIANRIDKNTTGQLSLTSGGSLAYANLNEIMEMAKIIAISQVAIPKHLRDNVGACLAVAIQAAEWQLSPFAVANKSYSVNDRLAYEAQLVASVVLKRAPIKGRIKYEFMGEGDNLRCRVSAVLRDDGEVVDYTSPPFGKIPIKNSPLWKSDPQQQIGYYSVRAMARRHFPDVLLGVYTPDEMQEEITRDVTPRGVPSFTQEPEQSRIPDAPKPTAESEQAPTPEPTQSEPQPEPSPEPEQQSDIDRETMVADLNRRMEKDNVSPKTVKAWAVANAGVASTAILTRDYTVDQLQAIDEAWESIR